MPHFETNHRDLLKVLAAACAGGAVNEQTLAANGITGGLI